MRKKGFQQSVGFLTKFNSLANLNDLEIDDSIFIDESEPVEYDKQSKTQAFNLNDFYMRFMPDKFCEMATKLKKRNRNFLANDFATSSNQHTVSIFQTDNLLRIYSIFTSETVDLDVKQNAGEQLAIMIATGDQRLHKAFINLDGVNYCIRYLKSSIFKNFQVRNKQHLFLTSVEVSFCFASFTLNKK